MNPEPLLTPPQPSPWTFTVESAAVFTAAATTGFPGVGNGSAGPGWSPANTCGRPDGGSRRPTRAETGGAGGSGGVSGRAMAGRLSGRGDAGAGAVGKKGGDSPNGGRRGQTP